jgi:hypothetical protein
VTLSLELTSMSLTQDLENLLDGRPGIFGVYSRNLTSDDTVAVNGGRVFPAEHHQDAILLHYERCVDAGALDPRRRLPPSFPSDDSAARAYCGISPTAWRRRSMTSPG